MAQKVLSFTEVFEGELAHQRREMCAPDNTHFWQLNLDWLVDDIQLPSTQGGLRKMYQYINLLETLVGLGVKLNSPEENVMLDQILAVRLDGIKALVKIKLFKEYLSAIPQELATNPIFVELKAMPEFQNMMALADFLIRGTQYNDDLVIQRLRARGESR